MANETDYEKMAAEYAEIRPFSLQTDKPRENEANLSSLAELYAKITALIDKIPTENNAKELILLSKRLAFSVYETYRSLQKKLSLTPTEREEIRERTTYTQAVRECLKASAKALALSAETTIESLPREKQRDLHVLLLTLTAF